MQPHGDSMACPLQGFQWSTVARAYRPYALILYPWNEEVRRRMMDTLESVMKKKRLYIRWFGHVQRMQEDRTKTSAWLEPMRWKKEKRSPNITLLGPL
jgi:hypothetical protein